MQLHTTSTWVNPHESDFELRLRHAREEGIAKMRHYRLHSYDGAAAHQLMDDLAKVLRTMRMIASETDDWYAKRHFPHVSIDDAKEHRWHGELQGRFKLHPAVTAAVKEYPPRSVHSLVFEWPHVSETDPNRLAYTRDNRAGHDDRQVVTTVGKYLTRHFPDMPDHAIRDLAARYAGFKFEMWDNTNDIVRSVQEGPPSCMQWDDDCNHPYEVYAPDLGWRAAVRLDGHRRIVGRCLVYEDARVGRIFVRSYALKENGYSHSDEGLESWLREQGYNKRYSWEGCLLAKIENGDRWLAPYLDGDCKRVDGEAGKHLVVSSSGRLLFDCTNGDYGRFYGRTCDVCGDEHDEEDTTWVGRHEDTGVCGTCIDDYTYVYGRRGNQYYIPDDDAVYCDNTGGHYDPAYLADNNIVELYDGDLCSQDDAVYLETRGEWWYADDDYVVHCEYDGTHEHIDDAVKLADYTYAHPDNTWECHVSGETYHEAEHAKERIHLSILDDQDEVSVHVDNIEDFYANLDAITGSVHPMLTAPTTI